MSNISITIANLTTAEAAATIALLQNSAVGVGSGKSPSMPSAPPQGAVASPTTPAPPPPSSAPSMPPVTAASAPPPPAAPPAAPPPPPAAVAPPPAAPGAATMQTVLQAMQAYGNAGHKAAGIKRVLAKAGVTAINASLSQDHLNWLQWAFTSGMTPDQIEAVQ